MDNDINSDDNHTGPGDVRMEPVDVDVLDNLINAQAAYLDAVETTFDHLEMEPNGDLLKEVVTALSKVSGTVLSIMAIGRI